MHNRLHMHHSRIHHHYRGWWSHLHWLHRVDWLHLLHRHQWHHWRWGHNHLGLDRHIITHQMWLSKLNIRRLISREALFTLFPFTFFVLVLIFRGCLHLLNNGKLLILSVFFYKDANNYYSNECYCTRNEYG